MEYDAATGVKWKVQKRSRERFPTDAIASLDISLHNARCSGRYFRCLASIVEKKFDRVEISLGDLLQRHNYISVGHPSGGVPIPMDMAISLAKEEGERWISDHLGIIHDIFGDRASIRRWSSWIEREDVNRAYHYYKLAFESEPDLLRAIDIDVNRFLRFRNVREEDVDVSKLRAYILEEIAVYNVQNSEGLYVHIYVGGELESLKALRANWRTLPPMRCYESIYFYMK